MLQQKKERNYHYDQSISLQNDYLRMLLKSRIKGEVFFLAISCFIFFIYGHLT